MIKPSTHTMGRIAKKISVAFVSAMITLTSFGSPIAIQAKAGDDFRDWKQGDPEYNTHPAWPKSLTGYSDHYLRQYGCLVTSIAILLRHYNLVTEPESKFNPLTHSDYLLSKKLYLPTCDLWTERIGEAYPNFQFVGREKYTPQKLAELYNKGFACIAQVKNYGHFVAIDDGSVPGAATIFDPDTNYHYLEQWSDINMIYYFSLKDAKMPDHSPQYSIENLSVDDHTLSLKGWAYDKDVKHATVVIKAGGKEIHRFEASDFRPDVGAKHQYSDRCGFDLKLPLDENMTGWTDFDVLVENEGWQGDLFDRVAWSSRMYVGQDITAPTISDVKVEKRGAVTCVGGSMKDDRNLKQGYLTLWKDERTIDELTKEEKTTRPIVLKDGRVDEPIIPDEAGTWKIALTALDQAGNMTTVQAGSMTIKAEEQDVTIYRVYNPNSGEHFYTPDVKERDALIKLGWHDEGIGWTAAGFNAEPVYRLYNPNAGDHHYTLAQGERAALIDLGWKDEGIGWLSPKEKSYPVYRQYNPNAKVGSHNYTLSEGEHNMLGSIGWHLEGIAWYSRTAPSAASQKMEAIEDNSVENSEATPSEAASSEASSNEDFVPFEE